MRWETVGAAAIGTAHLETNTPCQDRVWAGSIERDGDNHLVLTVADGAGSAACAEKGAQTAVEAVCDFVLQCSADDLKTMGPSLADGLVDAVRARLLALAGEDERPLRDFACTLLVALSGPDGTFVLQIGDGGIVLDTGNGPELVIMPMGGEYVNVTRFITDDDATLHMETRLFDAPIVRAAVFSDGLQRLALDLSAERPHPPFFHSLFGVLETVNDANRVDLTLALERFLGSEQVNARTDDDKAMALALLRT
ncbi:protein phosphatase 2C domain-containing protein [Dyella nitratireducens]